MLWLTWWHLVVFLLWRSHFDTVLKYSFKKFCPPEYFLQVLHFSKRPWGSDLLSVLILVQGTITSSHCFSWDYFCILLFLAAALNSCSYYLFSAAVSQYYQVVLMELCCRCDYAIAFKSSSEKLKSVKLAVWISRRECFLKGSANLGKCVKITD